MNTQFKKGVVEMCVLFILNQEDAYGYKIVQSISEYIETNENTIYPILHRLTRDHYLESYYVKSPEGPKRKYYKITDTGKTRLELSKTDWEEFVSRVSNLMEGGNLDD